MLLHESVSQLVLVDYQSQLLPSVLSDSDVLRQAKLLAQVAKRLRVPVYGTEQVSDRFGEFDADLAGFCKAILKKSHFNACSDGLLDLLLEPEPLPVGNARSLPKHLQKNTSKEPRDHVILAGLEVHVGLLQTALDLLENELCVWVVTDACASRSEKSRDAAFDRLAGNGAELVTSEMVVFEWLESASHESFDFVLDLLK